MLIILATVSINLVIGEDGIIRQAEKIGKFQTNAEAEDNAKLDELDEHIANSITGNEENPKENIDPETGWDLNKVNKVTSEDNVVVPVPKGYTASTVTKEKSVATGFVIKEGTDGSLTSGINEFVWVPVPEISYIYDQENNVGQLWEIIEKGFYFPISYSSDNNREPDVVTKDYNIETGKHDKDAFDAITDNLNQAGFVTTDMSNDLNDDNSVDSEDFKIQLQNEFTAMKNSVEKYGGFYIGRYETGNLSKSEAVVQKGNSDINNQTWYTMYKISKTIKANDNVISSMIWGSQWDATLMWMEKSEDSEVVNFLENSRGKGHFCIGPDYDIITDEVAPIATGSVSEYAVNNIDDMAGNVEDWTLEAESSYSRVARGSNYDVFAGDIPAYMRSVLNPIYGSITIGSRSTLLIAL